MPERQLSKGYWRLAMVLVVVFVLLATFLVKMNQQIDHLETLRFEQRLNELKLAVKLKHLALVSGPTSEPLSKLQGANPFEWMRAAPALSQLTRNDANSALDIEALTQHWQQPGDGPILNYLGERRLLSFSGPPSSWFYEPAQRQLYYFSGSAFEFQGRNIRPNSCIAFQVQAKAQGTQIVQLALVYLPEIQSDICRALSP